MSSSLNERSIMDLPDDILIMNLERLNVEDLKSICLVNSRFYELVTTTPSVNKKFKLNVDSNYNETIIEALMESNRHFENLAIPFSKHDDDEPCRSSQIIDLMKNVGGRVKNIEFKSLCTFVCPKQIFELLGTVPNIESLMFYSNNISSECVESLPTTTILKFTQLKEVHAPFEFFFRILKHVHTLEKLIVLDPYELFPDSNNSSKTLEFIEVLRSNQSTLKSLKFNTKNGHFDNDIQALCNLNLFEFVFELEFSDRYRENDTNIERVNNCVKFLSNQHQMKRLTFYMDNVAFWDPIMKMTNLEFLDININYNISNEQLLAIPKNHTNTSVKFLKIRFGDNNPSLNLCQTIVNYFSGVVDLDLSIFENEEEIPDGWVLSFDDHPALIKVKVNAFGNKRNELRALKIKQLEEFDFMNFDPKFSSDDWKLFTTNNPNIKSLTFHGPVLYYESLKYIVTNLVNLEELEFDHLGFPFFSYAGLRLILENCRNIKKIDVVLNEEPGNHDIFEEFAEKIKNITLNVRFELAPDYD